MRMDGTRRTVRVGVAGLGRIGRVHARNLSGPVRGAALGRVMDVDSAIAAAVASELDVPVTTSFEDLLDDDALDAVVIATPPPLHSGMVEMAAAAGRHVFCEKPIASDVPSAEAAVAAAERAGVILQVGFQMRWDRDFHAAAARIARGELGQVFTFRTTLRDLAPPTRGYLSRSAGFFADGAVHTLDLARWLCGEIEELSAFGVAVSDPMFAELGDVDNTIIVVKFAGGGLGTLENSRVSGYGFDANTEVMAEHGTLRIRHDRRHHLELLREDSLTVDFVTDFLERFADAYVRELEGFVAAVHHGERATPDGRDGVAAARLCEAAVTSYREARTVRLAEAVASSASSAGRTT